MPSMRRVNLHTWKQTLVTWIAWMSLVLWYLSQILVVYAGGGLSGVASLPWYIRNIFGFLQWYWLSFLKRMLLTWLSSGLSNQHHTLCISYLFLSFPPGPCHFFPLSNSLPRALPSWWLAAFGCSLLDGFKSVFLERRQSVKISLHWLFSVCGNPHDSHWLEYNLTRLYDYSARRLLISFRYSVWYWYWRKWKGKESSLKSCVVTSLLEHGKCVTSYGCCYFISFVGMSQS